MEHAKTRNLLFDLWITFAQIGLFTFGGGYAMISIIEHNCVERKRWISHDEMMNLTVIAESTPGPIAINAATYIGYQQAGIFGAVTATLGMVFPSFMVIYGISLFLDNFLELTIFANAFKGIKIAVGILILNAGIGMAKKMPRKPLPCALMIFGFCAMLAINIFSLNLSSFALMVIASAVSLAVFAVKGGEKK